MEGEFYNSPCSGCEKVKKLQQINKELIEALEDATKIYEVMIPVVHNNEEIETRLKNKWLVILNKAKEITP